MFDKRKIHSLNGSGDTHQCEWREVIDSAQLISLRLTPKAPSSSKFIVSELR
jgi:hypothetical protein